MLRGILIFLVMVPLLLRADHSSYQLGQGLQIKDLPVYIGGYFSIEYEQEKQGQKTLGLDELSLLAYGEHPHFSYLLELEAEGVYNESFGEESSEERHTEVHLERLYLTHGFNEQYSVTFGKFNTPVGFWNRIPINVLRDTTSYPMSNALLFPRFLSGVSLSYTDKTYHGLSCDTLVQIEKDFDAFFYKHHPYNNFAVNKHYGIGLSLQHASWSYQANIGYFRFDHDLERYYLLGALKYEQEGLKVQAEVGRQASEKGITLPYIGYLQGSYIVHDNHQGIIRLEAYHDKEHRIKDTMLVTGYTYRPLYPIALKGEYQWHTHHHENKMIFSFSVLF